MDGFIKVRVVSLRQLFSGERAFRLPWFQRAYAWQTNEAGRLLTDLFDVTYEKEESRRRYFLGSLMLAKKPGDIHTALVDGHQRVMTLTLLFAVLRDLSSNPASRALLQGFIGDPGYHLQTQENLTLFCGKYVQAAGATLLSPDAETEALSEIVRNVIDNREYFKTELSGGEVPEDIRELLIETLADRCFVILKEVEDEDEAWRMLEIEEQTRRDFNAANRAKASLLSMMPASEREDCRRIWDDCEFKLGSQDMYALLGHVRMLKLRKRSERPVEPDLAQAFALNKSGRPFMEGAITPAAAQLHALRHREVGSLKSRAQITVSIDRLTWIAPDLWIPAALRWLDRRGENGETAAFFASLERMVWMLRLAGIDPTRQQRQIIRLLGEIDKDVPAGAMKELDITRAMRESALTNLKSPTFDAKHYASRVLRRISQEMGVDPGPICPVRVTVEHVLPQGWMETSGWRRSFKTEKSVRTHAHRLGNLTFLTAEQNRAADACDWDDKRKIYAQSEFALTRELAGLKEWSPASIEDRTNRLSGMLFKSWGLEF